MSLSASVAVRTAPTSWAAAVFSGTLRSAVSAENAGGLLGTTTAAATWKTAESPYMGRVVVVVATLPLSMGPWPVIEEFGRPTRVPPELPSARDALRPCRWCGCCAIERLGAVVPAAGDRVVGSLGGIGAVGAGLVLVVDLVVPGPVVEILVLVGGLGAVEPVDGDALVGRGVGGAGIVAGVAVSAVQPTALKPAL